MLTLIDRRTIRRRIRHRIRRIVEGTAERPRIAVFRSAKHIYAQAIDDAGGRTLAASSTRDKEVRGKVPYGGNVKAAKVVGEVLAERLKQAGVKQVVFDRGGYLYHGRIRALAEGARSAGLKF